MEKGVHMTEQQIYKRWMSAMPGWTLRNQLHRSENRDHSVLLITDKHGAPSALHVLRDASADAFRAAPEGAQICPPTDRSLVQQPFPVTIQPSFSPVVTPAKAPAAPDPLRERVKQLERRVHLPGVTSIHEYKVVGNELLIRTDAHRDLARILNAGMDCSQKDIVSIGAELCAGLQSLHGKNMVHGSIRPGAVLLTPDKKWLLSNPLTAPLESPPPTPSALTKYWAPEQFKGICDARSDIYSLGLMLYTLLNGGKLPYQRSDIPLSEVISRRSINKPFPLPKTVDESLGQVLLKACACRPEDRYQTAGEFREVLEFCILELWEKPEEPKSRRVGVTPVEWNIVYAFFGSLFAAVLLVGTGTVACSGIYTPACLLAWLGLAALLLTIPIFRKIHASSKATQLAGKGDSEGALELGCPYPSVQTQVVKSILEQSLDSALSHNTREALSLLQKASCLSPSYRELRTAQSAYSREFEQQTLFECALKTSSGESEAAAEQLREALQLLPDSAPLREQQKELGVFIETKPKLRRNWIGKAAILLILFLITMSVSAFFDQRNELLRSTERFLSVDTIIEYRKHPLMLFLDPVLRSKYEEACELHIDQTLVEADNAAYRNDYHSAVAEIDEALVIHPGNELLLEARERISGSYTDYALASAAEQEKEQAYIDAYTTIRTALEASPDEMRLLKEMERLQPFYTADVEEQMHALLQSFRYDDADALVIQASSYLPDDETILNCRNYLEEIKPVPFHDLTSRSWSNWDTMGSDSARFQDDVVSAENSRYTNSDYVLLTMDIVGFYALDDDNCVCVQILGDGVELYSSGWLTRANWDMSVCADITGCDFVQIVVTNQDTDWFDFIQTTVTETIRLYDIHLWKTQP